MYLKFEKKHEDSDRVIYDLWIESDKCKCTYYKNTGAITLEPNIMESYYYNSDGKYIGSCPQAGLLARFFTCCKRKSFYPDKDSVFSCSS